MPIFFAVRARLHPVARWTINFVGGTLRLCLLLLCVAAVVFALVGLIRNQRHLHAPAHPIKHQQPIIIPYK